MRRNARRCVNLLREAHRTARVTPLLYPVVFPFVAVVLVPFLLSEPEVFDFADHV